MRLSLCDCCCHRRWFARLGREGELVASIGNEEPNEEEVHATDQRAPERKREGTDGQIHTRKQRDTRCLAIAKEREKRTRGGGGRKTLGYLKQPAEASKEKPVLERPARLNS